MSQGWRARGATCNGHSFASWRQATWPCPLGSSNCVAVVLRPIPPATHTLPQVLDGTRTVLLKVDRPYPYGEQEDAFKAFAKLAGSLSVEDSKGFLIAEVNVQNYGDKDNAVVLERLALKESEFPAFLLFKGGASPANGGASKAIRFKGQVSTDNLLAFVRSKVGLRVAGPGTVPAMEKLVEELLLASEEDRAAVLEKAKPVVAKLRGDDHTRGEVYLRLMEKVIAKGPEWPAKELKRMESLAGKKMSSEKRTTVEHKLKLLPSFVRDEL